MFIESPYGHLGLTTPDECRRSMDSEVDRKGHFAENLLLSQSRAIARLIPWQTQRICFSLSYSNDSITSAYVLAHDCSSNYSQWIRLQPHRQHNHRAGQEHRPSA